jgi:Lon protease-like protein
MTSEMRIPLFPLGVVVLPGMILPLHIFEERYKQMMSACLAEDKPFGVVLFDSQSIRSVGCTTRITEIIKRYDDGRMDIATRGEWRFLIREIMEEKIYMEARVTLLEDMVETPDTTMAATVTEAHRLLKQMAAIISLPAMEALTALEDPTRLSFAIAALEGFTPPERQMFLEMTSGHERLRKGVQALAHLLERLRLNREIKRLIGGNGHALDEIMK